MARKALTEVKQEQETREEKNTQAKKLENRLKKLIPIYGQNKVQADELKAIMDDDKAEIKRICSELSIDKLNVDGWNMSYKVKEKHIINEDKMLAILKDFWSSKNGSMQCPYIKTKEYIDHDALEAAIFNGDIADKDVLLKLKACDTVKQEPALTVSKVKEKK